MCCQNFLFLSLNAKFSLRHFCMENFVLIQTYLLKDKHKFSVHFSSVPNVLSYPWQLVKAHGVTRNKPKIHVICYITNVPWWNHFKTWMNNLIYFEVKCWGVLVSNKLQKIVTRILKGDNMRRKSKITVRYYNYCNQLHFCCPSRLGLRNTLTASLKREEANKCPRYDTKQSVVEVSVMVELWGMQSTPCYD